MANPFDFFDVIYCINLPDNTIRKQRMERVFEMVGILDRIQWIWAPPPPPDFQSNMYKRNPSAEFGVSLSQITAVVQSIHDQKRNMLVFEDDVEFSDDALERLQVALQELPDDWSCFHLGCTPTLVQPVSRNILRARVSDGLYAYALNGNRMLDFFKYWTYGITHGLHSNKYSPVDSIMTMFLRQETTRYCISPPIVVPSETIPSTITKQQYSLKAHDAIWDTHITRG